MTLDCDNWIEKYSYDQKYNLKAGDIIQKRYPNFTSHIIKLNSHNIKVAIPINVLAYRQLPVQPNTILAILEDGNGIVTINPDLYDELGIENIKDKL